MRRGQCTLPCEWKGPKVWSSEVESRIRANRESDQLTGTLTAGARCDEGWSRCWSLGVDGRGEWSV